VAREMTLEEGTLDIIAGNSRITFVISRLEQWGSSRD
jgi:hypothetical protein